LKRALDGDVAAATLYLSYALGKPFNYPQVPYLFPAFWSNVALRGIARELVGRHRHGRLG
jgi:hypothetical protein